MLFCFKEHCLVVFWVTIVASDKPKVMLERLNPIDVPITLAKNWN